MAEAVGGDRNDQRLGSLAAAEGGEATDTHVKKQIDIEEEEEEMRYTDI